MFAKEIEKINRLISGIKSESPLTIDSIGLISDHTSRPRTVVKASRPRFDRSLQVLKEQLPSEPHDLLLRLFKAKCEDLEVSFNQSNWDTFLRAFLVKNPLFRGNFSVRKLNLGDFELGNQCLTVINEILQIYPQFSVINLKKSTLDPRGLERLGKLKELMLGNCGLLNQPLEGLFDMLLDASIQRLILSSPELRNRNQLTRYAGLKKLISRRATLKTLGLSNIGISKDSGIIESCRGSSVIQLDLSDNSDVGGICSTLQTLNLSRNGLTKPFSLPIGVCDIRELDLSYNKIPYYHFKDFLKNQTFPNLTRLYLNRVPLNGDIGSVQAFLDQAVNLQQLSVVDCDLSVESYCNICNGVRTNRSLRKLDLTRNGLLGDRVAECLSNCLQSCNLLQVRLKLCDIKDWQGKIIFRNIRKNRQLQRIDLESNLLGDLTSRAICDQLKFNKNILWINLQENTIKYKDMREIQGYLEGNRHLGKAVLRRQYNRLNQITRNTPDLNKMSGRETERLTAIQAETQQLESIHCALSKKQNTAKREALKKQIAELRRMEYQLKKQVEAAEEEADKKEEMNAQLDENPQSQEL